MQELIKYISDILNIKTESVYTIQDMTEELNKVKDIIAYRSYIKDNFYKEEFKTGYQRFLVLTDNYLDMEREATAGIKVDEMKRRVYKENRDIFDEYASVRLGRGGGYSLLSPKDDEKVQEIRTNLEPIFREYGLQLKSMVLTPIEEDGKRYFVLNIKKMIEDASEFENQIKKKPYEELPQRLKDMTLKMLKGN